MIGQLYVTRHDYSGDVVHGRVNTNELSLLGVAVDPAWDPVRATRADAAWVAGDPVLVWRGQFRTLAPSIAHADYARFGHTGRTESIAPDPLWADLRWDQKLVDIGSPELVVYPFPFVEDDPGYPVFTLPGFLTFWCPYCHTPAFEMVPTIYRQIGGSRVLDHVTSAPQILAAAEAPGFRDAVAAAKASGLSGADAVGWAEASGPNDLAAWARAGLNRGKRPNSHTDD